MITRVDGDRGPERRVRILRAAADLFLARGYSGVSMDDVLAVVGGSKSTLYRYFADKNDLFRSAVALLLDERSESLRSFVPAEEDLAAALRGFGRHFADLVLDPRAIAVHRLVTAEAERVEGLGQAFFAHGPAVGQAVLGRYLRELSEAGTIRVTNPVVAGAQLYQAMLGDLQMRLLTNSPAPPSAEEIDASIAAAVEIFLHGALSRA